jgi:hydrogenase maturation protease
VAADLAIAGAADGAGVAPLLVLGWGNRSRGDDALGPLLVERLRAALGDDERVECLDDYQLQVEMALDLVGRQAVLLVDASLDGAPPFTATPLQPVRDASYSSHAMSPGALLQVYCDLYGKAPPACTLLAIHGERFELGEAPGATALAHLEAALSWAVAWVQDRAGRERPAGVQCAPPASAATPLCGAAGRANHNTSSSSRNSPDEA